MIKVKAGVKPKALIIAAAAANVAETLKLTTVITSGSEGKHMRGSKHYSYAALDFRTRDWSHSTKQAFMTGIQSRLGPKYQLVLEKTHLHIEFDPRPSSSLASRRGRSRT
jgi:hypothetical protein